MNPDCALTARRLQAIRLALSDEALTLRELAARVHVCLKQASRYISYMRDARQVYIATYRAVRRARLTHLPAYRLGSRKDVPKPGKMTAVQRNAAYVDRIRKDPERNDLYMAKGRARKRKPVRDEMVAALFGSPGNRSDRHA
jgi:DNA gyrase/topoisomerase IV subunit A